MTTIKGRLLVVDDNENNRDILARRLERQGHTVALAENGRAALALMRAQPFDLVLLDIMMPEMNGYEVLGQVRDDPSLRHLPIIVVSAIDELDSVVRCIELGAEDYLLKPINPVLLKARTDACLEKKRLRDQEQAYLRAIRREMELGRRIQADFLPEQVAQPPGWEIAVAFHPASEVAGDFYDAFPLPDGRVGLVIADVCDKGVGAALFMALVRSLIRAFAERADIAGSDPLDAMPLTNAYIARHHRHNRMNMFATLFFGALDLATGTLTYINGGHLSPFLIGPTGVRSQLEPTGPALGVVAAAQFTTAQAHLAPGDILLAYTDGVTEARAPSGAFFTEERLIALLDQPPPSADALLEHIETNVRAHIAGAPAFDDVTVLVVRRASA
jgi:serine phosphatase RsbU (regulator of sigma subunit)